MFARSFTRHRAIVDHVTVSEQKEFEVYRHEHNIEKDYAAQILSHFIKVYIHKNWQFL